MLGKGKNEVGPVLLATPAVALEKPAGVGEKGVIAWAFRGCNDRAAGPSRWAR